MTNGLPWEDVMRDQTDIHIAALELQWQARERELLDRNTQLVEQVRALEDAARPVLKWLRCRWNVSCEWEGFEGADLCEACTARKSLTEVLEGK